jgi:uncharacterized membrane protein YfcA
VLQIAAAGATGYLLAGKVDWLAAAGILGGALGGTLLGTYWLRIVPERALRLAFLALLVVSALRLVLVAGGKATAAGLDVSDLPALVVTGFFSGLLSGLLGVGGGVVMVPAMIVLFGIPTATAKGTSLVVIVPTSVLGTIRNVRNGNANLAVALIVGISGMAAGYVASLVSLGLDDRVSNNLLAALLTGVALRMVATGRRDSSRAGAVTEPRYTDFTPGPGE